MTALVRPVVRPAVPGDLPAVMTLERASFPSDAWSESSMRATLRDRDTVFVVAERPRGDGDLNGYGAVLVPRRADADVLTLAVAAGARGAGLGRTLLTALLDAARDRRSPRVFLEVRDDNQVAQRLYASVGFEPVGRRPRYYQPDDVDAITMRLQLTGGATGQTGGATT